MFDSYLIGSIAINLSIAQWNQHVGYFHRVYHDNCFSYHFQHENSHIRRRFIIIRKKKAVLLKWVEINPIELQLSAKSSWCDKYDRPNMFCFYKHVEIYNNFCKKLFKANSSFVSTWTGVSHTFRRVSYWWYFDQIIWLLWLFRSILGYQFFFHKLGSRKRK